MSDFILINGKGARIPAEVDSLYRLATKSVVKSVLENASLDGDSYNFNTGNITLTSGSKSAVAYLRNDTGKELGIETVGYLMGNSTGGLAIENVEMEIIRNPQTGTIITNAVPADVFINKNFGSSNTFQISDLKRYKGVEGDTFTDGELAFPSLLKAPGAYPITTGLIVLPNGSSIGVNITPQATNTSMIVQVFMAIVDLTSLKL